MYMVPSHSWSWSWSRFDMRNTSIRGYLSFVCASDTFYQTPLLFEEQN